MLYMVDNRKRIGYIDSIIDLRKWWNNGLGRIDLYGAGKENIEF